MAKVAARKKPTAKGSSSSRSRPVKKNPAKKSPAKKKGWRPSANVAGGKSYSQVAREILERTNGNRTKATAKLKELGCGCAAQIVWKMAKALGYVAGDKVQKKTGVKKATTTRKKPPSGKKSSVKKATKKASPAPKKKSKVIKDEDELEDEFEGEFEEELGDEDAY